MIRVGTVVDAKIGVPRLANTGETKTARMLQVQLGVVKKWVQFVPHAGEDVIPPKGSLAVLSDNYDILFCVATFDMLAPDASMTFGERKVYATDAAGNMLGYIWFNAYGKIVIANQTQNLKTILSNLQSALSTFATACEASTTDPTLVAAATTLAASLTAFSTALGALLA